VNVKVNYSTSAPIVKIYNENELPVDIDDVTPENNIISIIEVQGIKIPYTMQGVHMKGMRVDAEFQGNKIIDITTPTKGWAQNPLAGKAALSPITEDELKQKLDELDMQDPFVDYKAKGSVIESLGKDEEDGNEYFKIKMTTKNGNEKTYFFDTKTNLIYKNLSYYLNKLKNSCLTIIKITLFSFI
jgi:hypothetical protein